MESLLLPVLFVLLLVPLFLSEAIAESRMDITEDRDKTTYTIGSSQDDKGKKSEYEKDKERSWDMLKNIVIDRRQSSDGQQNNQQKSGQTSGK